MNRIAKRHQLQRTCQIVRTIDEKPVQENLSVSPERMFEMNKQGIAISTQNLPDAFFQDGTTENSFFIPIDERRGIDACALWEEEQNIKAKMKKGRKKDIETYGQNNPNQGKE